MKHNNFELRGHLVDIRETKSDKLLIITMKIWRGEDINVPMFDYVEVYVFGQKDIEWLRGQTIDKDNSSAIIAKGVISSGKGKLWKKITLLARSIEPWLEWPYRPNNYTKQQEVIEKYQTEAEKADPKKK